MNRPIRRSRPDHPHHTRRAALASAIAVGGVLLAGLALGAPLASAAPSASLVYSTDGGTTWTTTPTLSSGQNVLVRQYYNNDTTGATTGASITATVPTGFTRVAGSTQVCLNPGTTDPTHPTTELACNTSAGQGGAINESAVWSGTNLTISPTAGIEGQSTSATSGVLEMGKKRYLNLGNCAWDAGGFIDSTSIVSVGDPNHATGGTGASNTAATDPGCGPASGVVPQLTGIQTSAS